MNKITITTPDLSITLEGDGGWKELADAATGLSDLLKAKPKVMPPKVEKKDEKKPSRPLTIEDILPNRMPPVPPFQPQPPYTWPGKLPPYGPLTTPPGTIRLCVDCVEDNPKKG